MALWYVGLRLSNFNLSAHKTCWQLSVRPSVVTIPPSETFARADASIWLFQFMKAMRDDKGDMMRNAHLLGFFRRICR